MSMGKLMKQYRRPGSPLVELEAQRPVDLRQIADALGFPSPERFA